MFFLKVSPMHDGSSDQIMRRQRWEGDSKAVPFKHRQSENCMPEKQLRQSTDAPPPSPSALCFSCFSCCFCSFVSTLEKLRLISIRNGGEGSQRKRKLTGACVFPIERLHITSFYPIPFMLLLAADRTNRRRHSRSWSLLLQSNLSRKFTVSTGSST